MTPIPKIGNGIGVGVIQITVLFVGPYGFMGVSRGRGSILGPIVGTIVILYNHKERTLEFASSPGNPGKL